MTILESKIEDALDKAVKSAGGFTRKTVYQGRTAAPDRQVFMPGGHIYFVELKQPGKKPRPSQEKELGLLKKMGFDVWVIDSLEDVQEFRDKIWANYILTKVR